MPTMTIRVTNATFASSSSGDFGTVDDAFRAGILSGVEIAASEVSTGSQTVIVEVAVDLVGRKDAARGAVAISTARFMDVASA